MAKTAWQSDLPVHIDRSSDTTLSRQIYGEIARGVLDGHLLPGSRLPSARRLSIELGVARNTVNVAYDQLVAEGYIERVVGSGSRVTKGVRAQPASPSQGTATRERRPQVSRRGLRLTDATLAIGASETHAESIGNPALDAFPTTLWRRLMTRQLERLSASELGYGAPRGYAPLCAAIAEYLARTRRLTVSSDRIIVVGGAQQAYDLMARLLLDAGDVVLFEEPGYPGARAAFLAAGATLRPVMVDGEGANVESLRSRRRMARMAYTTPAHQFPLGPTLSLSRRLALLEWAEAVNAWILEDDYDGEFRYAGNPISALASLDRNGRVIYVGTFSKLLFPALRIGFVVVPSSLAARASSARGFMDRHCPILEQATLAAFMEEGHLARHTTRMRSIYAERRAAALRAFHDYAGDIFELSVPETGVHLVARFQKRRDDRAAAAAVRACGLAAMPLSSYYIGTPRASGLLVSFANLVNADAVICRVAKAVRGSTAKSPAPMPT